MVPAGRLQALCQPCSAKMNPMLLAQNLVPRREVATTETQRNGEEAQGSQRIGEEAEGSQSQSKTGEEAIGLKFWYKN